MASMVIEGRELTFPALIPSISSFETQLSPPSALRIQLTMQEPVSLVSAFDLLEDPDGKLKGMCRAFRKRGIMFLDSGGYETSRRARYLGTFTWDLATFLATAETDLFDFAFSFDEFPDLPSETWQQYATRLETLLDAHTTIEDTRLIPVVHLRDKTGIARFSVDDSVDLVRYIAEARDSRFVAVTERELGAGLSARVALARQITGALQESGVLLHVLGCGNPLSFAAFAEAGVSSCDGLEWCRTYCSSDMRLYHFQHGETIGAAIEPLSYPAEEFLEVSSDYYVRTSVVNLNNFAHIVRAVQAAPSNAVAMLENVYGESIKI